MQDKPSETKSPAADEPNEDLAAAKSPVASAPVERAPETMSWTSPEMRPTLWRGLAVIGFILFASVVLPLLRPPADPDDGEPDPAASTENGESQGTENPPPKTDIEPAKPSSAAPPAR